MIKNKLTLDYVLPRLKELFEKFESVETAILFGSITRNKFSVHDIDIALKLNKEDLLETGYIIPRSQKLYISTKII
jgi:predicted nucleotidyltransferase